MKINFRKDALLAITPSPNGKPSFVQDTKTRGLAMMTTPKGIKSFYIRRRANGKPEKILIGRFPDVTIENARAKADEINSKIGNGINPADLKRNKRKELTLEDFFNLYISDYAKKEKRTWQEDIRQFEKLLPATLKKQKLSSITISDIELLHQRVGENNGPYAANRLLALIKTVFNLAIKKRCFSGHNPAIGIQKFDEHERERSLNKEELGRFFKTVAEEKNLIWRDFFLLAIFTGARKGNIMAMEWTEIDFNEMTWKIPSSKSKSKKGLTITLSIFAIEILKKRLHLSATSAFVFPSSNSNTGHIVQTQKAWENLCKKANLKDLRFHDLRHSLGSWLFKSTEDSLIVQRALGHSDIRTTLRYINDSTDVQRQAIEKTSMRFNSIAEEAGVKLLPMLPSEEKLEEQTTLATDIIELTQIEPAESFDNGKNLTLLEKAKLINEAFGKESQERLAENRKIVTNHVKTKIQELENIEERTFKQDREVLEWHSVLKEIESLDDFKNITAGIMYTKRQVATAQKPRNSKLQQLLEKLISEHDEKNTYAISEKGVLNKLDEGLKENNKDITEIISRVDLDSKSVYLKNNLTKPKRIKNLVSLIKKTKSNSISPAKESQDSLTATL